MKRDELKERVQQATDLVQLIGEHVALRPRGSEFVGLCPFHDDSRPSLYVSPTKQIYKCFACGAGGDVFSFMTDFHRMEFAEALRHLGDRAGIQVGASSGGGGAGRSNRDRVLEANRRALRFFRQALADERRGNAAREYLSQRGIGQEMVDRFQIGYAPDGWDGLLRQVERAGWDRGSFELASLIRERTRGTGHFDFFRHRLIFPIFDALGRPIAFGGRRIRETDEPKFLNTPETPVFEKAATLFGLQLAQRSIVQQRTAVVVEGYTDVIAAHAAGATNVVATLGTALTRGHARTLRRFCERLVLVFDPDEAGLKAADRALELFFNEPVDVQIAVLPDGLDPAELLMKDHELSRWQSLIEQATDAMTFQFERLRSAFGQAETDAGRVRIAQQYIQDLGRLGLRQVDPLRRGLIVAKLAELLRVDVQTIERILRQTTQPRGGSGGDASSQQRRRRSAIEHAEWELVGCLLCRPELFHEPTSDGCPLEEAVLPGDLTDPTMRRVYEAVHEWLSEHTTLEAAELRSVVEEEELFRAAIDAKLEVEQVVGSDSERIAAKLSATVAAMKELWAERAYQRQKLDSDGVERAGDDTAIVDRLGRAIAHSRDHPSAKRTPRPSGA